MAGPVPCTQLMGNQIPQLKVTAKCIQGGCPDKPVATLTYNQTLGDWAGGGDWVVFWQDGTGYVLRDLNGSDGNAVNYTLTFRCLPTFHAVALRVGPDKNGCYYEVTVDQVVP